jgi:hypothetical protein
VEMEQGIILGSSILGHLQKCARIQCLLSPTLLNI